MKYPKRTQYKYSKKPYRIRNWRTYEQGLRSRGDLTIWFSEDAIRAWRATPRGKPGGQRVYANIAIETALTIRMVYHLALRQAEGFLRSLSLLLELDIPIPDHTTLSRRAKKLGKIPFAPPTSDGPIHILIDSTGLRIHVGHRRKPPKDRAWRKLHLAVDRKSGKIVAAELTAQRARDAARVPALLKQIDGALASASADGAYDVVTVYEAVHNHNRGPPPKMIIAPRKDAQLSPETNEALRQRNRHIRSIDRVGRRRWEKTSGYSKRSQVENSVFRYKAIIGRQMRSRTLAGQRVETRIGCKILNKMTDLGMPNSYRVN